MMSLGLFSVGPATVLGAAADMAAHQHDDAGQHRRFSMSTGPEL